MNLSIADSQAAMEFKLNTITSNLSEATPLDELETLPLVETNLQVGYVDPDTGKTMGWHWVTITKYFQSFYSGRWIAVSSWDERYSLDWDAYLAAARNSGIFPSGFVWFE